jgi:putative SOS response-associated peptidase YedK
MCGRFVSAAPAEELVRTFEVAESLVEGLEPSYNVAPTNAIYTVDAHGGVRRLTARQWGLVPFWAKDPKIGNRMINARSETLATKNSFRQAYRKRRCLIPADGFYEWRAVPGQKAKQPYHITSRDGAPLAFAGLWEQWRPKDDPDGAPADRAASGAGAGATGAAGAQPEVLETCTIITCGANETMAPIHDRMPVILSPDAWDPWLDVGEDDTEALGQLLVPAPPTLLRLWPVTRAVNNVRDKRPHLVDVDPEPDDPDPLGAAPEGHDGGIPAASRGGDGGGDAPVP